MIGIGAITIYYTIKIYSGKCRPRIPLAIEQPNYDEEEILEDFIYRLNFQFKF